MNPYQARGGYMHLLTSILRNLCNSSVSNCKHSKRYILEIAYASIVVTADTAFDISALINISTKNHLAMTRSRFPAPWAITQLVFRTISVGLSVATLIGTIYSSMQYGYGRSMVGSYIAVRLPTF